MDYASDSEAVAAPRNHIHRLSSTIEQAVKLVVVGGFGVGKTTFVGSVSEITPLSTEERMTQASTGIDDLTGVEDKTSTTVAMDFGRITLNERLVLYLFGTPGQERFWFMWRGLFEGALGAVVLIDTRRLDVSFDVISRLEERRVPFLIAINAFPEAPTYPVKDIREALDLPDYVPIVDCDARCRRSSTETVLALMDYLRTLRTLSVSETS